MRTREDPPGTGARLLTELAALGPYFAVDVHRPGSPLRPPWRPLGELTGSPDTLAGRISEVRERLAAAAGCPATAVEFRVAASIAQLGLCARLLSPALPLALPSPPISGLRDPSAVSGAVAAIARGCRNAFTSLVPAGLALMDSGVKREKCACREMSGSVRLCHGRSSSPL